MKIKSTPLGGCVSLFLKTLFSNFRSHIKDSKWGRKCIFMNCASRNGSPQQIPLRQLPFANEAKPHSHCRGLWAYSFFLRFKTQKGLGAHDMAKAREHPDFMDNPTYLVWPTRLNVLTAWHPDTQVSYASHITQVKCETQPSFPTKLIICG